MGRIESLSVVSETLLKLGQMEILKILITFSVVSSSWTRLVSANEKNIQNLPDSLNLLATMNGEKLSGAANNFFNAQYTAFNSLLGLINEFNRTSEGVNRIASSIYPGLFKAIQNYDDSYMGTK
ncbi:hypothetical protein ACKWTF_002751 [Chironomus riparius]